ncbi:MAG: urea carboxylase-associated family protein [Alphaproteobacteria bacterium]|nr:urea carboxylase-associated family protein [Alphaproteobacteria bacterium]MBU0798811.1 urea carboxylase-associated family protein [Alphaproteobacteria bacterium]MBU0886995.1 urea carboxylase-associated family protein [Alphaproteobacteria bacterium]MBU1813149.1 urea carboxylase-associated family protein [Alphaproteobacteria bacterium]MBU2089438.1 urea carboxylase-associated family protein [Alphaproteobacteria bacterium]
MPIAPATIRLDEIVPPKTGWSQILATGEQLKIVDLEGEQAVDFLAYAAEDPAERYNAADTMKIAGSIFLTTGSRLYSDKGRPLLTIIEDTVGFHDTIGGCCSRESNIARYGKPGEANCRDNFLGQLKGHGLGKRDIVANINFFMAVPVLPDGAMAIADSRSKPGDYVLLRAETDVLVVLSNCPQMFNPAAGYKPTPIRCVIYSTNEKKEAVR